MGSQDRTGGFNLSPGDPEAVESHSYYFNLYQCCGSGMFIPDPGSRFLPIPDPGSRIPDPKQQHKRGVATNFTKFKIILFFKWRRKKFGPVFKEL
jgi:hypothetical protein